VQLYPFFVSQSSEFCRHNPLCSFSTSIYYSSFLYWLSPETFGYTLVQTDSLFMWTSDTEVLQCVFRVRCFPVLLLYQFKVGKFSFFRDFFSHSLTVNVPNGTVRRRHRHIYSVFRNSCSQTSGPDAGSQDGIFTVFFSSSRQIQGEYLRNISWRLPPQCPTLIILILLLFDDM